MKAWLIAIAIPAAVILILLGWIGLIAVADGVWRVLALFSLPFIFAVLAIRTHMYVNWLD